jgi:hypothetical protein
MSVSRGDAAAIRRFLAAHVNGNTAYGVSKETADSISNYIGAIVAANETPGTVVRSAALPAPASTVATAAPVAGTASATTAVADDLSPMTLLKNGYARPRLQAYCRSRNLPFNRPVAALRDALLAWVLAARSSPAANRALVPHMTVSFEVFAQMVAADTARAAGAPPTSPRAAVSYIASAPQPAQTAGSARLPTKMASLSAPAAPSANNAAAAIKARTANQITASLNRSAYGVVTANDVKARELILNLLRGNDTVLHNITVRLNRQFNVYVHADSRMVFDKGTGVVTGYLADDGAVLPLLAEHITFCARNNITYAPTSDGVDAEIMDRSADGTAAAASAPGSGSNAADDDEADEDERADDYGEVEDEDKIAAMVAGIEAAVLQATVDPAASTIAANGADVHPPVPAETGKTNSNNSAPVTAAESDSVEDIFDAVDGASDSDGS